MTEPTQLDKIFTTDEAAERLRLTRRALIKLARRYGHCSRSGPDYLFSEADLLAIWQDIRQPPSERVVVRRAPISPMPNYHGIMEELRWLGDSPPTSADRRVLGILEWLSGQRAAKTYKQIERAGPKTIEMMLRQGFVMDCGTDVDGLTKVKIAPAGRDQLKIVERWKRKRADRMARRGQ